MRKEAKKKKVSVKNGEGIIFWFCWGELKATHYSRLCHNLDSICKSSDSWHGLEEPGASMELLTLISFYFLSFFIDFGGGKELLTLTVLCHVRALRV